MCGEYVAMGETQSEIQKLFVSVIDRHIFFIKKN